MTLVTALIRDTVGNIYANALVEASFLSNIPAGTGSGPPLASGSVFQTFAVSETDSFGNLSMNLTDLAAITPSGGSWNFNVLNNARTVGFGLNSFAITGVSVDISAALQAASAPLGVPLTPGSIIGNLNINGNLGVTGAATLNNLDNIRVIDGTTFTLTDAGIQAAINAVADGGMVILPQGIYVITNTITITKRITICGGGWGTVLQVGAGVGATTPVFLLKPATASDVQGMRFQDFYIAPASGTPGSHGFEIDGTNASVAYVVFEHVRIDPLGSYALAVTNAGSNVNGTPYTTTISNCQFWNGMDLTNCGDTVNVDNSTFPGAKEVIIEQVGKATAGANTAHGFHWEGNNVSCTGGFIVRNSWGGLILGGEFELSGVSTNPNGAMVDLQGNSSSNMQGFKIIGAYIAGSPTSLRIDRCTQTLVLGCLIPQGTGAASVVVTANADRTQLHAIRPQPNNVISTWLSDSGTNTDVDFKHQSTGFRTIAGNGLAFSSIAGVTGIAITPAAIVANPTNGVIGFSGGDPSATAPDTVAWRAGSNQWAFGNAFGDVSGNLLYKFCAMIESAATGGVAGRDILYADSTAHRLMMNNNNGGATAIAGVIASGTVTLTANATLGAVTSQAVITTAATGALTSDAIEWSYASAPGAGDSLCIIQPYVTANNVNFVRSNPTAAAQNVSAIVINWRVIR